MLTQIYYKQNELFEAGFFEDEECTQMITDCNEYKKIYIKLKNGDITPLMFLYGKIQNCNLFVQFLPNTNQNEVYSLLNTVLHARGIKLYTLSNVGDVSNKNAVINNTAIFQITPNLSKYIPEDNAIVFWNIQESFNHNIADCFIYNQEIKRLDLGYTGLRKYNDYLSELGYKGGGKIENYEEIMETWILENYNRTKLTLFLPHITQETIQKANEVRTELKEKYGVTEVNLMGLNCFLYPTTESACRRYLIENSYFFNKIITTNSTGILEPQNSERLQVIDCKEIFEDYLKENN